MAKKTIAKTLFIGLGGTGNLALKYAKKRFYEIYKKDGETFDSFNIPLIQYLALDTDKDDLEEGFGEDGEYKLKGADLCNAKLMQAKLKGACLEDADLTAAYRIKAALSEANVPQT